MKTIQQALSTKNFPTTVLFMILLLVASCTHKKKDVEFFYSQAAKHAEAQNFAKALEYAHRAISLQPSPHSLALKATLLYQNGQLQESKKTFELALQKKNISPLTQTTILNNYAVVLARLGYKHRAQTIWLHLVKNKSYTTPEVAWFNLGLLSWQESERIRKKNPRQALVAARTAVKLFSKAIALESTYVDAYFLKAQIFVAYKNKKDAMHALKKVLVLDPTHLPARRMMRELSVMRKVSVKK